MLATKDELWKKIWKVLVVRPETNYFLIGKILDYVARDVGHFRGLVSLMGSFCYNLGIRGNKSSRATFLEIMYSWRISYFPRFKKVSKLSHEKLSTFDMTCIGLNYFYFN